MKLKSLIMLVAVAVGFGDLSGIRAYSQTAAVTTEMHYRLSYAGAPIIEEPTNSIAAVTNIVIGTNYTGTVQIGANIWKMSELQKRKWFNKIIVPTYVYSIIIAIVLAGLYALSLFHCAGKADDKIEELRSAADMKVNDHTPRSKLQRAALEFAAARRNYGDTWAIQDLADRLDNQAFEYVVTELVKAVKVKK